METSASFEAWSAPSPYPAGVYFSRSLKRSRVVLEAFLSGAAILGLDEEVCRQFGQRPNIHSESFSQTPPLPQRSQQLRRDRSSILFPT